MKLWSFHAINSLATNDSKIYCNIASVSCWRVCMSRMLRHSADFCLYNQVSLGLGHPSHPKPQRFCSCLISKQSSNWGKTSTVVQCNYLGNHAWTHGIHASILMKMEPSFPVLSSRWNCDWCVLAFYFTVWFHNKNHMRQLYFIGSSFANTAFVQLIK